ncbi:MAG: glycosyltransferase family 4 protein [Cyanobacteria bacterium J06649_4]
MRIAYTTTFDLQDPESWPRRHLGLYGAGAKIVETLKTEQAQVFSLGSLTRKKSPITRLKWQFYRKFQQKDFYSWADTTVSRHYARQIQRQLSRCEADILLCPENAIPLAKVKPSIPMVLWTDTTLGSLIDFYPYLSNLCEETRRNLLNMEQRVVDRCALVILNSQWAADQAQELYGVPPQKIKIIPRGSSQTQALSKQAFETALEGRKQGPYRLLFVGVDWERKGGSTAFGIAEAMNARGIETELHVIGCIPPFEVPNFVVVHGFVDRTTLAGQAKMANLFQSAHFLLYPTRADAMGVVLSEAASFGVPSLASNIGGISSVVKTDITGKTFSLESEPEEYSEFAADHIKNPLKYEALARSTFDHYQNNVSWSAVGEQARKAFATLLKD